jgi:hypothetical protein
MKISRSRLPEFLTIALLTSLGGCSGESFLSENSVSNGQQLPFDAIVIGPGERVSVDALPTEGSHYFCSNGAVLECERFGLKLYCSCPGAP